MSNQSFSERLTAWMRGRYGADELGNVAVGISVVLLLINLIAHTRVLSVIALVLALYACWRMSSKGIAQRRAENRAFLKLIGPAARLLKNPKGTIDERRSYRHLTCPSCGQQMRVPRGKGKMRVTCPKCHQKFDARS